MVVGVGTVTYQTETWAALWPVVQDLLPGHWQEVTDDPVRMPVTIAIERYQALEAADCLALYTVRVDGELAGYLSLLIAPHTHYATVLHAMGDAYYIAPALRSTGLFRGLLHYAEADIRARGVQRMLIPVKLRAKVDATPFFVAEGWTPEELVLSKWVGD
jgi:GNAT superfamily N-acetyltransferase